MTETTYHIIDDNNGLLTLIDPLDLKPDVFIAIDFHDCESQQVENVSFDSSELLEFDF